MGYGNQCKLFVNFIKTRGYVKIEDRTTPKTLHYWKQIDERSRFHLVLRKDPKTGFLGGFGLHRDIDYHKAIKDMRNGKLRREYGTISAYYEMCKLRVFKARCNGCGKRVDYRRLDSCCV